MFRSVLQPRPLVVTFIRT